MSELTDKQEKFAQLVVKLGNKTEAYRRAYDCSNMTLKSINVNASQLSNDTKVTLRIQEIRNKVAKRHQLDLDNIIEGYLEIINQANHVFDLADLKDASKDETRRFYRLMSQANNSNKIAAYKELARLLKLDEPDESKGDTNITNFYFNEKKAD